MNDFFLVACLEDFIENARLFIFETFCRIHQCISIRLVIKNEFNQLFLCGFLSTCLLQFLQNDELS